MEKRINPHEKDRLFCFIFGREENKAWTLSLYNAVNGTSYSDPSEVEITTMEDVVYMGMKNDVSFIVHSDIQLYEHQSSYNPNMPVRQLMYLGRQYDKYIKKTRQNIYGHKQMRLPLPKLVTFFNGTEDIGDRVLRLSDSFPEDCDPSQSDAEVCVHLYNVRAGVGSRLLDTCKPLAEYAWFVEAVRTNHKTMAIEAAVDKAIRDMPEDYGIKEFLVENQSEVKNMCLTEYDEAETMQLFKEEYLEEGREEGMALLAKVIREMKKGKTEAELRREYGDEVINLAITCR